MMIGGRGKFAFGALVAFVLLGGAAAEVGRDFRAAMVKVRLRFSTGMVHENRLLENVFVSQLGEFPAVVYDSKGHVVSYFGARWPELTIPGIQLTVETSDGRSHPAELVGVDERISVGVLASKEGYQALTVCDLPAKGSVRLVSKGDGEWCVASLTLVKVATEDLAAEREIHVATVDKPSGRRVRWEGSYVLDEQANLVGFVTKMRLYAYSRKLDVCQVLPGEVVRESVRQILKTRGNIRAGWLGVLLAEGESGEPVVVRTEPESPASVGGLRPGDAIIKIGGRVVDSRQNLVRAIGWAGCGREIGLLVRRQGRLETLSVRLSERRESLPKMVYELVAPPFWNAQGAPEENLRIYPRLAPWPMRLGFQLNPIPEQLAEFFKCPSGQGLLVSQVSAESLADRAGFKAGDVLIQINGKEVSSTSDLWKGFEWRQSETVVIRFVRDGKVQTRSVSLP
jgi:serine protease Do